MKSTNFKLKSVITIIIGLFIRLKARLKGKRFYCNALTGNSSYNICINSDMTVSCNCQDYDGSGHIGDLYLDTLVSIFKGAAATQFRQKLFEGKFPISVCARCAELRLVNKNNAGAYLHDFTVPHEGIMVENTVACNYKCIGCDRNSVLSIRNKNSLDLDDIRKISLIIKECQIKQISFFNLGEPFISADIYNEINIIRNDNPDLNIVVSTNGVLVDSDIKRDAALKLDKIYFSIDGVSDEILKKYQMSGSFRKAYGNMKDLVDYRNSKKESKLVIEWKYVCFNWNDKEDMVFRAIELAMEANVDGLSFWLSRSPFSGISWRYYFGSLFKTVKLKSCADWELKLNNSADILSPIATVNFRDKAL